MKIQNDQSKKFAGPKSNEPEKLVENVDYYFENGLMVLTSYFLKRRGYCCENNCRHCPYSGENSE